MEGRYAVHMLIVSSHDKLYSRQAVSRQEVVHDARWGEQQYELACTCKALTPLPLHTHFPKGDGIIWCMLAISTP